MDMTTVTYAPTSPYAQTPQENQYLEYLGFWNGTFVEPSSTDGLLLIQAKYNNRPDLLSNDLYGSTAYWWIFTMYNPDQIQDPIYDLKAGMTIRFPNKNNLQRALSGYAN